MSILAARSSSRQQLRQQENIVRALCVNALPLARQHESRYRTACHGHVSLYVTANKPAGGKNKTPMYRSNLVARARTLGNLLFKKGAFFLIKSSVGNFGDF